MIKNVIPIVSSSSDSFERDVLLVIIDLVVVTAGTKSRKSGRKFARDGNLELGELRELGAGSELQVDVVANDRIVVGEVADAAARGALKK